jgi:hypothetical protein
MALLRWEGWWKGLGVWMLGMRVSISCQDRAIFRDVLGGGPTIEVVENATSSIGPMLENIQCCASCWVPSSVETLDMNGGPQIPSCTAKLCDVPFARFCSFHVPSWSFHRWIVHCCESDIGSVGDNLSCLWPDPVSAGLRLTSSWCCDAPNLLRNANVVLVREKICHESPGSEALKACMNTATASVSAVLALPREPVKPTTDSVM